MSRLHHSIRPSILLLLAFVSPLSAQLQSTAATTKERIITLGDSTTTGYIVDAYTTFLQADLPEFEVINFGHSGATISRASDTPYELMPEYSQALQSSPDHVIMMFGLNDSKAHNWHSPKFITQDYQVLIDTFADLPSKPSIWIVTPIPVIGSNSFGIDPITMNNLIVPEIRKLDSYRGAQMIDLHLYFLDGSELYIDDAHPNSLGAKRIAYIISDVFLNPIANPTPDPGPTPEPTPTIPPLLAASQDVGGDWYRLGNLGDYYAASYPWIWHSKLGWVWTSATNPDDLWFYSDSGFGFFWTSQSHFPYIWRESTASWYYFDPTPDSTLIFNYRDYRWEYSPF